MRLIGCNQGGAAFLEGGVALPASGVRHGYNAFEVDQPDGTQILAYCENAYGRSDTIPIVLPEVSGLVPAMLLLAILWRVKRWRERMHRPTPNG